LQQWLLDMSCQHIPVFYS